MKRFILAVCLMVSAVVFVESHLMAANWTADQNNAVIVDKLNGAKLVQVLLEFKRDGVSFIKDVPLERVDMTTAAISDFCKGQIIKYEASINSKSKIVAGPVDLTDVQLTPEEVARAKYFKDLSLLGFLKQTIDSGVPSAQVDYDTQKSIVDSEYKKEYYLAP